MNLINISVPMRLYDLAIVKTAEYKGLEVYLPIYLDWHNYQSQITNGPPYNLKTLHNSIVIDPTHVVMHWILNHSIIDKGSSHCLVVMLTWSTYIV